jgi:hypothetical protein
LLPLESLESFVVRQYSPMIWRFHFTPGPLELGAKSLSTTMARRMEVNMVDRGD